MNVKHEYYEPIEYGNTVFRVIRIIDKSEICLVKEV